MRDKACPARVGSGAASLDGFAGLSPAPVQPPPSSASMGSKTPVSARGRGGRTGGGHGTGRGGRGGPGRGRKSATTKAAEKATLAAFLAAKYGSSSRVARDAGVAGAAEAEAEAAVAGTEAEAAAPLVLRRWTTWRFSASARPRSATSRATRMHSIWIRRMRPSAVARLPLKS